MSDPELIVALDDRARLAAAVLAASQWPTQEQAQLRHAVHPHAKQTRQQVQAQADHPAVRGANAALIAGRPPDVLFTAALRCSWPDFAPQEPLPTTLDDWAAALPSFAAETAVIPFWAAHAAAWQEALTDLTAIFAASRLPAFLGRLAGRPLPLPIVVQPNLVFPALHSVLAETAVALHLLLPPPKAVGESPPWPYREGPDGVLAESCRRLLHHALAAALAARPPAAQQLIEHAAITLFLEQTLDEAEALAYMVRSKKQFKLPRLPLAVEEMRGCFEADGQSLANLAF